MVIIRVYYCTQPPSLKGKGQGRPSLTGNGHGQPSLTGARVQTTISDKGMGTVDHQWARARVTVTEKAWTRVTVTEGARALTTIHDGDTTLLESRPGRFFVFRSPAVFPSLNYHLGIPFFFLSSNFELLIKLRFLALELISARSNCGKGKKSCREAGDTGPAMRPHSLELLLHPLGVCFL